jgi:hypothetical protein
MNAMAVLERSSDGRYRHQIVLNVGCRFRADNAA